MPRTSALLASAKIRISPPGAWIQNRYSNGLVPWHPSATQWCLTGAVYAVLGGFNQDKAQAAFQFLNQARKEAGSKYEREGEDPLKVWNDSDERRQSDVLSLFSSAIALAKAAGE